jgi:hypothetical protein
MVTALLVYLNWSPKVWAPLLSAFAVGLVTVIIAIFANLKDTDIQRDFASSVVIDQQTRLAVFYVPTGPATPSEKRLMFLSRLAQPILQKDGKPVEQFKGPENDDEIFPYYGELLQYYLLKELGEIQRRQFSYSQTTAGVITELNLPPQIDDLVKIAGSELRHELAKVRFASNEYERFQWETGYVPVPQGTTISLDHQRQLGQVEQHLVRMSKTTLLGTVEMFSLGFSVQPIGMTGPGQVPTSISIQPPQRNDCRTVTYRIRLRAHFGKLTSSNESIDAYQRWAQWLFENLESELQD